MARNVDINLSPDTASRIPQSPDPGTKALLWIVIGLWGCAVAVLAQAGVFARLYQPIVAVLVAATIAGPTTWYFRSAAVRRVIEAVGHRRIVMFHIWRIPAALVFFWYGAQGLLPPVFWILAGIGDLLAGLYALRLSLRPENPRAYRGFHRFGFADFIVAVGTGLTFTLLLDARMSSVTALPLALIPLFGVGISGASHLMAFDMLRRNVGFQTQRSTDTVPQ
jgi:hypothetical protein